MVSLRRRPHQPRECSKPTDEPPAGTRSQTAGKTGVKLSVNKQPKQKEKSVRVESEAATNVRSLRKRPSPVKVNRTDNKRLKVVPATQKYDRNQTEAERSPTKIEDKEDSEPKIINHKRSRRSRLSLIKEIEPEVENTGVVYEVGRQSFERNGVESEAFVLNLYNANHKVSKRSILKSPKVSKSGPLKVPSTSSRSSTSSKTSTKALAKAPSKPPAKTAAKPPSKTAVKTSSKPSVKTPSKTAVKTSSNTAVKTPSKIAVKTPSKTSVKTPSKTSVKTPSKTAVKTASKTAVKTPSKTAVKTPSKTAVKTPSKTAAKTTSKTSVKTQSKTSVKTPSKTAVKTASKTAVKTPSKTAVKTPSKTAVKTSSKTAVKTPSKSPETPKSPPKSPLNLSLKTEKKPLNQIFKTPRSVRKQQVSMEVAAEVESQEHSMSVCSLIMGRKRKKSEPKQENEDDNARYPLCSNVTSPRKVPEKEQEKLKELEKSMNLFSCPVSPIVGSTTKTDSLNYSHLALKSEIKSLPKRARTKPQTARPSRNSKKVEKSLMKAPLRQTFKSKNSPLVGQDKSEEKGNDSLLFGDNSEEESGDEADRGVAMFPLSHFSPSLADKPKPNTFRKDKDDGVNKDTKMAYDNWLDEHKGDYDEFKDFELCVE